MKISPVLFKGSAEDENTYQLGLSEYNGEPTVVVLRNFKGDQTRQGQVPSGWYVSDVAWNPALCIDFGQKWYVYPTKEAWASLFAL